MKLAEEHEFETLAVYLRDNSGVDEPAVEDEGDAIDRESAVLLDEPFSEGSSNDGEDRPSMIHPSRQKSDQSEESASSVQQGSTVATPTSHPESTASPAMVEQAEQKSTSSPAKDEPPEQTSTVGVENQRGSGHKVEEEEHVSSQDSPKLVSTDKLSGGKLTPTSVRSAEEQRSGSRTDVVESADGSKSEMETPEQKRESTTAEEEPPQQDSNASAKDE